MRKITLVVVLAVACCFCYGIWSVPLTQAQVIQWKFQDTYEGVTLTFRHPTSMFIKMVETVSQGRIKVTRYEPGAFVQPAQALDGLSKGMYDVAYLYPGYYAGTIKICNVEQGLPFAWTTPESHYTSLRTFGLVDLLREEYAKHNIMWLEGGANNDLYNIGSKKPIRKMADAKGLKIRAIGVYGDYVKLLGATPVNVPSGELYMALKLGTIDGVLLGGHMLETHKLGEIVKYYMRPTTNTIGANICVNMDSWKKLDEPLRKAIEAAAFASWWEAAFSYGAEREHICDNLIVQKYGVQYTRFSPEEEAKLIKLCQTQIWPQVAALDPACAKGVEIVKQTRKWLGMVTAE